jgi:hypothetical protein
MTGDDRRCLPRDDPGQSGDAIPVTPGIILAGKITSNDFIPAFNLST